LQDLVPEAGVDQQGGRARPVQQPPQVPLGVGRGQLAAGGDPPALPAPAQRAGAPPHPAAGRASPRRAEASGRRPSRYSSAPTTMEASAMPPTHQNQAPERISAPRIDVLPGSLEMSGVQEPLRVATMPIRAASAPTIEQTQNTPGWASRRAS